MKIWWNKVRYWEFWSANIVYLPTFFYWLWMMIKFRSFSFYKYANPGIKNGGLYGDSKMDTYQLFPTHLYPKSIFIQKNSDNNFLELIEKQQLCFPLVLKPDIGLRGKGVVKVNSIAEIENYFHAQKTNFIIQELIPFPQEIGMFYCRLPHENEGKITGITIKNFLTIEGNGIETIEQILLKNHRHAIQISKLKNQINLKEILMRGEKRCIVPFGNHSRGTEFLDGKALITEKLEQTFNAIFESIPGFYFGRFDIRYRTFEELEQGVNFSIIEFNGVKSEPSHIYDPKHSFWFGQKEIFRHQKMMENIIQIQLQRLSK